VNGKCELAIVICHGCTIIQRSPHFSEHITHLLSVHLAAQPSAQTRSHNSARQTRGLSGVLGLRLDDAEMPT
jgi:hypothetical protein